MSLPQNILRIISHIPLRLQTPADVERIIRYSTSNDEIRTLDNLLGGGHLPYHQTTIDPHQLNFIRMASMVDFTDEVFVNNMVVFMSGTVRK